MMMDHQEHGSNKIPRAIQIIGIRFTNGNHHCYLGGINQQIAEAMMQLKWVIVLRSGAFALITRSNRSSIGVLNSGNIARVDESTHDEFGAFPRLHLCCDVWCSL
eukprot:520880_1